MIQAGKKRVLEIDTAGSNKRSKTTRQNPFLRSERRKTDTTSPHGFGSSTEEDARVGNALASYLNKARESVGHRSETAEWANDYSIEQLQFSAVSPSRSFIHQPLEAYRQAQALRLLFIKHGLQYKQPSTDMDLLSDTALAPYIAQWEDCLAHWYPIMSSEPLDKTKPVSIPASGPLFGEVAFNVSRVNKLMEESGPSPLTRLSVTNPFDSMFHSAKPAPWETVRPPFQPTIAQWANTPTRHDDVRQIVQSEVKRQLDDLSRRNMCTMDVALQNETQKAVTPPMSSTLTAVQDDDSQDRQLENKVMIDLFGEDHELFETSEH